MRERCSGDCRTDAIRVTLLLVVATLLDSFRQHLAEAVLGADDHCLVTLAR
jgi:hypothetical protein